MKYPIYIPSKGRAAKQRTVELLHTVGIQHYYVIVEKDDFQEYAKVIDRGHLICLPKSNYGTSSVARNTAIKHSLMLGFDKHWQLDDDISKIFCHGAGKVVPMSVKLIFEHMETVSNHYPDVAAVGMKTSASFLSQVKKDINFNTSLTSLYLLTNTHIKFRLNMLVDMDYQLQLLEAGYKTMRFNKFAFIFKTPLTAKGGYYDIYANDVKRRACLEEFLQLHPEIKPGIKRCSAGFLVLENISRVWARYK